MENLHILTDEQLVQMAQEGSETAEEILIEKYKDFVKLKAKSHFIAGADEEDVIQEGTIGLFKAIRSFDGERDASFKTFADRCINGQIVNAIKKANRKKNQPLNKSVPFETSTDDNGEHTLADVLVASNDMEPENALLLKEIVERLKEDIEDVFSPLEKKVLDAKLKGLNYQEIAKALNKSPKSIDNTLQRIKKKVIAYLEK